MDMDMNTTEKALASLTGISAIVLAVVGGLKALFSEWVKGKEPVLALVAAYALTLAAKLSGILDAGWVTVSYAPILIAVAAQLGHDKVLDPVVKMRSNAAAK